MYLIQLYIENCEKFDEYLPDGSCRKGLRMTLDGFQNALRKFSGQIAPQVSQPSELLSCPFCGGKAKNSQFLDENLLSKGIQ